MAELQGEQNFTAVPVFDFTAYQRQVDLLAAQTKAMKIQARKGEKTGKISKHKSPQVKRSLGFLFDTKGLEDINEILCIVSEVQNLSGDTVKEAFLQISECVNQMNSQVNSEMLANKMASKSQYGWKTVKCFETDSLFKGLNDKDEEASTKKFKAAEFQAARELKSVKKGPRSRLSRFSPYYGAPATGSNPTSTPSTSSGATKPATTVGNAVGPCFKCKLPGHIQKYCPN